jgi:hypothetical protein
MFRISSRHLLLMSYESRTMINHVSIHLFRTRSLLCSALRERLGQAHGCLLIMKSLVADGLSDLHGGHQIDGTARTTTGILDRFQEGVICYLFMRLSDLFLVGDLRNLEVIIYDDSLVCQIPMIDASTVRFFLADSQFLRLRRTLKRWRPIFNTVKPPSFQVLSNYYRQPFVLVDRIHEISEPMFLFSDMRHPSIAITDYMRSTFQDDLCQYCSAVRIRGASCAAVRVIENRFVYIYHRQCHWTCERKRNASMK